LQLQVAEFARLARSTAAVAAAVRQVFLARGRVQFEVTCSAREAVPGRVLGRAVVDCRHTDIVVGRQFLAVDTLEAVSVIEIVPLVRQAILNFRTALVVLGGMRDQLVFVDARLAVSRGLVLHAVRHFGHTRAFAVPGDLVPILAEVAPAVVVVVGTVVDDVHADLVVVLGLACLAELRALAALGALHLAVGDCRAALVLGDFHLGVFAAVARA